MERAENAPPARREAASTCTGAMYCEASAARELQSGCEGLERHCGMVAPGPCGAAVVWGLGAAKERVTVVVARRRARERVMEGILCWVSLC